MKIDIHYHCITENYVSALRESPGKYPETLRVSPSGEEELSGAGGPQPDQFRSAQRMVKELDESGLDLGVVSVFPWLFHYELDAKLGAETSRQLNEGIAQVVGQHPSRFVGVATVPLQHPPTAIRELERAVNQLGMRAVEIGSNVGGKNLDEPELLPFFEKAQALDVLIFVHPCTLNVAGKERMGRYLLSTCIGLPTDTALAIGSLIYGGVLARLPKLRLCFAHAGGSMPYLIGRLDHGYKVRPECKSAIPKAPSEYFKRLYFDTAVHSEPALLYLIQTLGSDHVLLGSDYPAPMMDAHPVATVGTLAQVSEQDKRRIWGENAVRLLKLGK